MNAVYQMCRVKEPGKISNLIFTLLPGQTPDEIVHNPAWAKGTEFHFYTETVREEEP